jgi:glyoxylase I family protein
MIVRVVAAVVVDDLPAAKAWYAKAFGRKPDAEPMGGLLEWHLSEGGWLQVVDVNAIRTIQEMPGWGAAGASSVSFVIDDLAAQLARFEANGIPLGPQHTTPDFNTATVRDPFGNLITFVEARKPTG